MDTNIDKMDNRGNTTTPHQPTAPPTAPHLASLDVYEEKGLSEGRDVYEEYGLVDNWCALMEWVLSS